MTRHPQRRARIHLLLAVLLGSSMVGAPGATRGHDFGGDSTQGGAEAAEGPDDPGCSAPDGNASGQPITQAADPVSPFTGKWFLQHLDLEVAGVFPIRLVRRYDSQTRYQSPLGAGWAFTYDMRLFEYPDGSVVVRNACGQRHLYTDNMAGGFTISDSPGWRQTLAADVAVPGGFVLTGPRGTQRFFDTEGRLTEIRDPQDNALHFAYSATKQALSGTSPFTVDPTTPLTVSRYFQLQEIAESTAVAGLTGRKITFTYDPTSGRLASAQTHDGRQVVYTHELIDVGGNLLTTGNLTQVLLVTDPAGPTGIVQSFGYLDSAHPHAVTSFQDGQGMRTVKNEYDAQGRVQIQKLGTPDVTAFTFSYGATGVDFEYAADATNCGGSLTCTVVTQSILDEADALLQTAKTAYKYEAGTGFPVEIIDAEGHQTVFTYLATPPEGFLDTIQILRFDGEDGMGNPIRSQQKLSDLDFLDGNLTSRVVTVDTAAGGTEVITETWIYDEGWVSEHSVDSDAPLADPFTTQFTFWRNGLNPDDGGFNLADPIENIFEIKRLHFDLTEETTTLAYDGNGSLERVTLPDGHEIVWTYHTTLGAGGEIRRGLVSQVAHQLSLGGDDPNLLTTFDYDAQGKVKEVTDARLNVTKLTWDPRGRLTESENALNERTRLAYEGPTPGVPGRLLVSLETGRVGATEGEVTQFLYDPLGNLNTVQRQTSTGIFTDFSLFTNDTAGQRRTSTDAVGRTLTFGYDRLGRRTSTLDLASHQTLFTYDAVGNLTRVTDAEMFERVFSYDALDRLIQLDEVAIDGISDALTGFAYDAVGNLTKLSDPEAHETAYVYDALSRLKSVTRPGMQQVNYEYDLRGRLARLINARAQVLVHDYEDWGPLQTVIHYPTVSDADADTNRDRTIGYSYDETGNLLTVADSDIGAGSLYTAVSPDAGDPYDGLNRLRKLQIDLPDPGVKTLAYLYDRFGNPETLTLNDGGTDLVHTTLYDDPTEDLLNRLKQAELLTGQAITFGYLDNDDLDLLTRASGATTDVTYAVHGPISAITVTDGGAVTLDALSYPARDALDRIQTLTETFEGTGHTYTYDYDPGGRLTDATYPTGLGLPITPEDFGYDLAGNREDPGLPAAYDYSPNDELTTSPFDPVLCYDDDGNLATKRSGGDCTTGPITETFTFNAVNRLTRWTDGTTTVDFLYDPFGRRVKKAVSGGATTGYVWDGDQLVAEYDASGNRQVRYSYAGGFAPVQVAYPDGGGGEDVYDVHTDHLDTPRMLTDQSTPPVAVWRAAYEAFGTAQINDDPDGDLNTVIFNIRFPGQYFDAETGLHYNRFRYYDPEVGRYVSADPIGQFGILDREKVSISGTPPLAPGVDANSYRYVIDDPANLVDPDGQGPLAFRACVAIGAAIALSTAAEFNRLSEDLDKVNRKLESLENACPAPGSEAEFFEMKEKLRREKIEILAKRTSALAKGGALGTGAALVCSVAVPNPFLP